MTSRLNPRRSAPLQVHAQEHLGPVLRFGAAGAGMNGDDGVGAIVLAAEHLLGLGGLDFLLQLVERRAARSAPTSSPPRPTRRARRGRRCALLQRLAQREVVLDAAPPLHDLLRFGLVVPEVGLGDALLDLGQLLVEAGSLKDASAALRPAGAGLRIAVSGRRDPRHVSPHENDRGRQQPASSAMRHVRRSRRRSANRWCGS